MLRRLLVLLALAIPALALAQETVAFVPVGVREDAPPVETPRFKHLAIVVDMSGSVRGDARITGRVLMAAEALTQAGSDDWAMTCIAFGDRGEEWPHGWIDMPNGDAPRFLNTFLTDGQLHGRIGGGTQVVTGLRIAFQHARSDMLVAVVTDGELGPVELERVNLIQLRTARLGKRLPPAPPVAFLVTGDPTEVVRALADLGGGGLFAIR